jgi:hypothetical protein
VSDLERTIQSNWQLCNAIAEYHQAVQAVLNFTKAYLDGGGDPTNIPERWNVLDTERQAKYAAMLSAAGITQ